MFRLRSYLWFLCLLGGLLLSAGAHAFDHGHTQWDGVLKSYLSESGDFDYRRLQADSKRASHAFPTYLKQLQGVSSKEFERFSKAQKMAFLINAYNALTVKLILDHYPVASIKKIGGFFSNPWKIEFFSLLDGKIKAIDPIEHVFLRPSYRDYRIHAAVNCASISCPTLRGEAFVASRLNKQLNQQMKAWLADTDKNSFDAKRGTVKISKLFDWYEDDFMMDGNTVEKVLKKYGPAHTQAALKKNKKIKFAYYDWGLNDIKHAH